jgi:glycerol uptake facilitator-like aquaporin
MRMFEQFVGARFTCPLAEVILTALFGFVVLVVTSELRHAATAGLVFGPTLTVVHLIGIPLAARR